MHNIKHYMSVEGKHKQLGILENYAQKEANYMEARNRNSKSEECYFTLKPLHTYDRKPHLIMQETSQHVTAMYTTEQVSGRSTSGTGLLRQIVRKGLNFDGSE